MSGELKRKIGFTGLTMVAVGSCIGSGIFIVPSDVAGHLGDPSLIFLVWALGGAVALTGSLTFAELGAQFPKAGGVYVFIREAFGPLTAFLYGWSILSVITSGAIAALSLTFARYVGEFVPLDGTGQLIVGASAIISLTLLNSAGVRYGEAFTNIFTSLKILGILLIVGFGIFAGTSISEVSNVPADASEAGGISAIALAMIGVLWSFGGWHHASYLSAETRNAEKTVPRAMIAGALIVTITYLMANWGYMRLLSVDQIAGSQAVAADALSSATPIGGKVIACIIMLSTFGSIGIFTMSAPRIYFAMARDGKFFKYFSQVHPRSGAPVNAIILQSAWALVLLFIWGTFEKVIASVVFMDWVFMIIAALSIFVYRRRKLESSFRTPGYPIVPLIFIAISLWFLIYTLFGRPEQALWGLGLLVVGLPVYYLGKRNAD